MSTHGDRHTARKRTLSRHCAATANASHIQSELQPLAGPSDSESVLSLLAIGKLAAGQELGDTDPNGFAQALHGIGEV